MLILSDKDVEDILPMEEAIVANAKAFYAQFTGKAIIPNRIWIQVPRCGPTLFKPGLYKRMLGLKVVSVRAKNKNVRPPLPTVPATVVMFDSETGLPSGILAATFLTALRTAAGSGVATDFFARPNAKVLTVFGAGLQAQEHIRAMLSVRKSIKTIFVINRTVRNAEVLAVKMKSKHSGVIFTVINPKDKDQVSYCIRSSDIIVCATNSNTPLFNGSDLKAGTHINGIGSYAPEMQEVDVITVKRSKLILDSPAAVEAGDLSIPLNHKLITQKKCRHVLGEFVTQAGGPKMKSIKQFKTSPDDITFFKSVGTAVQDIVTSWRIVEKAKAMGVGVTAKL